MSEIDVIRASVDHVDLAAPLFDRYRSFYGQPVDLSASKQFLQERLTRGESVVYLAMDRQTGEGVGFTQLYPTFSSISVRRFWILNDLFVEESYRSRGIGRRLLEAARGHAMETDAEGLTLSTAIDNMTAQKLYESFGFIRDEVFYHYDLIIQ